MNQQATRSPLDDQSRFELVSEAALLWRINRKLRPESKQLKRTHKSRWRERMNLGMYYVLDTHQNSVVDSKVDVELLGRDLGVLHELDKVILEDRH